MAGEGGTAKVTLVQRCTSQIEVGNARGFLPYMYGIALLFIVLAVIRSSIQRTSDNVRVASIAGTHDVLSTRLCQLVCVDWSPA